MPIAELLGVQFDMHLLLKMSLSVATVLLVSWAYRFYSSRCTGNPSCFRQTADSQSPGPSHGTCQNCKTALQPQTTNTDDTDDEDDDEQLNPSHINFVTYSPDSDKNNEEPYEEAQHPANKVGTADSTGDMTKISVPHQDTTTDKKMSSQIEKMEENSHDALQSTLNLPSSGESGLASPTGRHSPCSLQLLEGFVGVGRELRQDLGRQGGCSTFLSKAEITVADASLVLEETGHQIVRSKIYDYYVESSSHSVTDSNHALGQYERKSSDSQAAEYGSGSSSLSGSPSSLSPIIMRDLVLLQSTTEDLLSPVSPEPRHLTRPVLLRKESYLTAAEHSELPVPFLTEKASTPVNHSRTSLCEESNSASPMISPSTDNKSLSLWEEPSLETVAGAPFLHIPTETDLEGLKGKLDLGNCMETLSLAKKHGHYSLQQAALRVMSDNYLQVLRDPRLYGRLMAGERDQIQKQRNRGRRFVIVADMDPQDWVAGRQAAEADHGRVSSSLYYYDDYKDTWHSLCSFPKEVISKGCAMCTMDNYLFVALGCQGTDRDMIPSKRVFCYNPLTSIWNEISPMNEARPHCKLAALQGYVYAIGGECLSTVERYDPWTDRWSFVAPLPNDTFAVAHRATVCNGEIYVSGGTLRYQVLRYNPKTNSWRPGLMVGSKDRSTDMTAVKNFVYRFEVSPVLGISVYRYHTMTRLWYECSTKRMLHCPSFQCVAMDDSIYCVSRQFTMRFKADEISPGFIAEDLSVLSAAKGILFPLVLSLPDKTPFQTSV